MITKKWKPTVSGKVALQFGTECIDCGFNQSIYLELGHGIAKSNGGTHENNLFPLCSRCNKRMLEVDYRQYFTAEKVEWIESRWELNFTDKEVNESLAKLIILEMEYVSRASSMNATISEACKRAYDRKGMRALVERMKQESVA